MGIIVKQFQFKVRNRNNDEVVVYAKIERMKKSYYWDISHFYRPCPVAGYYILSGRIEMTIAMAEEQIDAYISCLRQSKDFQSNPNY